jgi:hypothetical protein
LSAASPVSVPAVSRGDGTDAATAAPRGSGILSLLTLGVGAGKTSTYDAECSSAFLLQVDGAPALLLDLVRAQSTIRQTWQWPGSCRQLPGL